MLPKESAITCWRSGSTDTSTASRQLRARIDEAVPAIHIHFTLTLLRLCFLLRLEFLANVIDRVGTTAARAKLNTIKTILAPSYSRIDAYYTRWII
jgi:hypothetical protein